MGWRTNVVLLGLVGGMGSYLYFNEPAPQTIPPGPTTMGVKLLPKGAWVARQIWFQHDDNREPILLEYDTKRRQHMVADPSHDLASAAVLESILTAYDGAMLLSSYTEEDLAADPELIRKTGLHKPHGRIEFRYDLENLDDKVVVEFGDADYGNHQMWVRVRGEIFRADAALRKLLNKDPDDFREKLVFTGLGGVRSFRFEQLVDGQPKVHVLKMVNGAYRIREPIDARVDPAISNSYFASIESLRVERFVSGGIQDAVEGRRKDYQLTMEGSLGTETLEVTILENGTPFAYLKRRNIVFSLAERGLKDVATWHDRLRQRQVLPVAERDIQRIEIVARDGGKSVYERQPTQSFRVIEPVEVPETHAGPFGELLHVLTRLEASKFVDDLAVDTGTQDGESFTTVRVRAMSGARQTLAVRFGKDGPDDTVYARREDEKTAVLVPADVVKVIRKPWVEFASHKVPPMTVNAFRLEVRREGAPEPLVYILSEEMDWQLEGSDKVHNDVRDFVDAFRTFRAAGVVPLDQIPKDLKPVRLLFRRNRFAQSGEIYQASTYRWADGKEVLLVVPQSGIAYRIRAQSFVALQATWQN